MTYGPIRMDGSPISYKYYAPSLLFGAAARGCFTIVKELLLASADPSLKTIYDNCEESPLSISSHKLHKIKTIIETVRNGSFIVTDDCLLETAEQFMAKLFTQQFEFEATCMILATSNYGWNRARYDSAFISANRAEALQQNPNRMLTNIDWLPVFAAIELIPGNIVFSDYIQATIRGYRTALRAKAAEITSRQIPDSSE